MGGVREAAAAGGEREEGGRRKEEEGGVGVPESAGISPRRPEISRKACETGQQERGVGVSTITVRRGWERAATEREGAT